jgi:hypothetical protein
MAEADVLNHLRNSFEFPHPTRKQVARYLNLSKTPQERKVWRDLLNSEAFHKSKIKIHETKVSRKVDKAVNSKQTKRK